MTDRLSLTALPGFEDDLKSLPTFELQKMALGLLVEVRNGTVRGVRLDHRVATGDLSDCFKLHFDTDGSHKPNYRLVYRYQPDEVNAVSIEAVGVDERADLAVYRTISTRLARGDSD